MLTFTLYAFKSRGFGGRLGQPFRQYFLVFNCLSGENPWPAMHAGDLCGPTQPS